MNISHPSRRHALATIMGSNDGITYDLIYTIVQTDSVTDFTYNITTTQKYNRFRYTVEKIRGTTTSVAGYFNMASFNLFGDVYNY